MLPFPLLSFLLRQQSRIEQLQDLFSTRRARVPTRPTDRLLLAKIRTAAAIFDNQLRRLRASAVAEWQAEQEKREVARLFRTDGRILDIWKLHENFGGAPSERANPTLPFSDHLAMHRNSIHVVSRRKGIIF